ncbi:hypothetical protein V8G54_036135 [Vigna mungo]|uniref:Uncharacterized protein n=1 Tax=Vigna mungo TaxID=3915 RepID=A0AAQ3MGQ8_VIGMU
MMLVLVMSCSMENDDKEKTTELTMTAAMTDKHQQFLCMSTTCHENYYPLCFAQKSQVMILNGSACVERFIGGWRDCDEIYHLMLTEEREHNPRMVKGVFAFVGSVLSLPLSSSHSHAFAF